MANKRAEILRASDSARADESLRIDSAHVAGSGGPAEESKPVAYEPTPLDLSPAVTSEQVRSQAAQLALQLQRQQLEIDHRESELNARIASMENQIRAARLWIDERQTEITTRELELDRRQNSGAVQETNPSEAGVRLSIDDEALRQRAAELDRRAAELDSVGRRFAERFGIGEGKSGLEVLEAYRGQLEHSEKLLATAQAQWQEKFRELSEQRAAFAKFVETERKKLADDRRRWGESHQQDLRELKRQQVELANRQGALEALRVDVVRRQQEALEIQLATQELWSRLATEAPPAAIANSLGQIRLRLAEEFRLIKADLVTERSTIKRLAEQVAGQHRQVAERREQLQSWLATRLRDFEQLSSQLAERERVLEERRQAIESERSQWQAERFRLEQELRNLLRHSGSRRNASAA
jgi:hypothetical protein